jgi:erythromycin esterase
VEWIAQREERLLVLAHNQHIQRTPCALPWLPETATLGHHLAASLGPRYLAIGTTCGSGEVIGVEVAAGGTEAWDLRDVIRELDPLGSDTIDGLIAAGRSEPGVVDLRTLTPADVALVDAAKKMRCLDQLAEVCAREAFDLLVHVPHVTLWHSSATSALLSEVERT